MTMREHPWCRATGSLMAAAVAGPLAFAGAALADPLPLPQVDFALKGDLKRGTLDLAHSQGRMRIEIAKPGISGTMISLIDLKTRSMVVRTPSLPNMALEIELPAEYVLGALSGSGTRVGEDKVAGEACNLWKVDPKIHSALGPTTACITPDGIALRTDVEIKGKAQTVFEATSLTRAPQDQKLFQLPPGVQVVQVPKGKLGAALGLPGLAGALQGLAGGAQGGAATGGAATPPAPKP